MRSCSFDMRLIREFDIFFFEGDPIFLIDPRTNFMFIEPTEDFASFSFESEFE